MLPQSSSSLRSLVPLLLFSLAMLTLCLVTPPAPAGELDLAGLNALEASPPVVPAAPVRLDLSGLDRLAAPLSASHGLQLTGLQELEHVAPEPQPAAQLVVPAAVRPPAAGFCVNGQCYQSPTQMTPKAWRQWQRQQR